jgi:pSer/pThr/pTyr-binding forkhead associated (FHA) protein
VPAYELEIRDEGGAWRFALGRREVVRLGRSRQNDCVVKARGVSRNHCLLLKAESGWKLVDLKSSNASFVRGNPVHEASLEPGDSIRLGLARLWFLEEGTEAPVGRTSAKLKFAHKSGTKVRRPPAAPGGIPGASPDGPMGRPEYA